MGAKANVVVDVLEWDGRRFAREVMNRSDISRDVVWMQEVEVLVSSECISSMSSSGWVREVLVEWCRNSSVHTSVVTEAGSMAAAACRDR